VTYRHCSGDGPDGCRVCEDEDGRETGGEMYPHYCKDPQPDPVDGLCAWCGHSIEVKP
jgi:hypothetical protein